MYYTHYLMQEKRAVLLLNLGSPASTSVPDVRAYLNQFLWDERVLNSSALVRWLVLNVFILPRRPAKSAEAYEKIWTKEGSPLITESKRLQENLQKILDLPILLGMRYGKPSTGEAIERLKQQGIEEVFVMPLYPHYAMSSYETAVVHTREEIGRIYPQLKANFLQPFYQDAGYIDALVENAKPFMEEDFDHLLFSFHGIPESHLRTADSSKAHCLMVNDCCKTCSPVQSTCYKHQCLMTVKRFIEKTGLDESKYSISFQSRLGREPWLKPYTDHVLEELPKRGVKKLLVMCPSFVADCLETLEEITMSGRDSFIGAGGEEFAQIPCLNNHPKWIEYLAEEIRQWHEKEVPELV